MALIIVNEKPPIEIYEGCDLRFKIRGRRGVIFTVGGKLYNPDGVHIEPWLLAHEEVHSTRQLASGDVNRWWAQYLDDKQFRFREELEAHREEWAVIQEKVSSRQQRRANLAFICKRLSGSLYGNMVSCQEAKRIITNA